MYLIPVFFAWILHSTSYFFIIIFPTAFYDRSRMTGIFLIPLKNRTHLYQILTTPVGRVWRFTHFYSVAPLLEKRFACFPTSGDGLRLAYFPYFPVMQRRLFLFDPFLYFLFFSYKKPDFFFPGKLK